MQSGEFPALNAEKELLVVVRIQGSSLNQYWHSVFKDRVLEVFDEMDYPGEVIVRSAGEEIEELQPHINIVVYQWGAVSDNAYFCSFAAYLYNDGVKTELGLVQAELDMPYTEKLPVAEKLPDTEISPIAPMSAPIRKVIYLKAGYDQVAKLAVRDLYHRLLPFTDLEDEMAFLNSLEPGLILVSD